MVTEFVNPPGSWRIMRDGSYQYWHPGYAVYGTVHYLEDRDRWLWDARVMWDCRIDNGGERTRGVTPTLKGAMQIVETVCRETRTCDKVKNY